MSRGDAQLPLLVERELRGWRDRPAPMVPGRVDAPPGAIERLEQRADVRDGRAALPPRSPRRRTGRGRGDGGRIGTGLSHHAEDTAQRPGDRARRTGVLKCNNPGDDLFSRKAALSVSSALESLTSVFGMGTGVASPLESPGSYASGR